MKKQQAVWRLILKSLQLDVPVMLLYVLESSGSSPGRQGFLMAVNQTGEMEGSIGGGIMEHKFVEMAKEQLLQNRQIITLKQQFHDKKATKHQSGMICSGEQTLLLYSVKKSDTVFIEQLLASLDHHQNGLLQLSPKGLKFSNRLPETDFLFTKKSETDWLYEEKTGYKNRLFIVGAGHCSLAFSRLMRTMDFYIQLFDNRLNLNTWNENESAHEKVLVKDYAEIKNLIPSGENHYIVIMTFGYRTDDAALKAVLNKNFKYLGILGSKTKIRELFNAYHSAGISTENLNKIHWPIGLQIKSQTPEEIAVSIAAEIIQVKNAAIN